MESRSIREFLAQLQPKVNVSLGERYIPMRHRARWGTPNVYGAMTTMEGRFSIATIVPGSYTILVERRGYSNFTGKDSEKGKTLEIKAGDEIKDMAVRLVFLLHLDLLIT